MVPSSAVQIGERAAPRTVPQWVVFACEGHHFGVPLARVREILPPRPCTRLPGCGPVVCGLMGLRGRAITVFDLGVALSLRPAAAITDHRLLIVETGERLVGFAVEEVVAVTPADLGALVLEADVLRRFDVDREDILGVGTVGSRAFLALDSDRIASRLLA